ncbi:trypsin-like peptidase domain-containing protein [Patescibacteria group bacterium]|nr:trypsin-like peptidase domain-containing protein [Patescibacteria group bacterium]
MDKKSFDSPFWYGMFGGIVGGALLVALFLWGGLYRTSTGLSTTGRGNQETKVTLQEDSAIIEAVKQVSPSVVSIVSTRNVQGFFGNFEQTGAGTGFIIQANGLIATNKHVVSDQAKYTVLTSEGKSYDAEVVATDSLNDLALIKISATNLKAVDLGDSDALKVGQRVIAIGNALGEYQNTVTTGVVSAMGRSITAGSSDGTSEKLEGLIQTDATINPGNSGGPLVNLAGQVIGINTAIDLQGSQIGFAIPINSAKSAIDSYVASGKISRPMLGIRYINITKEISALNDLPVNMGALVVAGDGANQPAVTPGGPAAKAGIKEGDIIISIDNQKIDENHSIISILRKYKPGGTIAVKLLHDGKEVKVSVKLGELK